MFGYFSDFCVPSSSKIEVFEGARDNLPDADAHHAAMAVLDLTKGLHDTDILIVLISGNTTFEVYFLNLIVKCWFR